jgi:cytochrome c biogenesis protein CcdA
MLLGLTFSTLGFQLAYLGILAKLLFDYSGQKQVRIKRFFSYNRSVAISAILFLLGVSLIFPFISNYVESDFVLNIIPKSAYMAITGLEMLIFSFINFAFTLLFHGLMISKETNKK